MPVSKRGRLKNLPDFEIGEPFFLRNLLVFPFLGGNGNREEILTTEEAREAGILNLEETQRVNSVILSYEGHTPLYMIDGEEIIGAYQNRVLNTSIYVEEPVRTNIPVSCVEEGRWTGDNTFRPTSLSAYPSLRAIIASSVTESLKTKRSYDSDQRLVWSSIKERLTTFKLKSMTSSMHDLYESLERDIESYIREFGEGGQDPSESVSQNIDEAKGLQRCCGFLAFSGDRYLGMELFSSRKFFEKFKKKLLTGYVLDALSLTSRATPLIEINDAKKWVDTILSERYSSFPGVVKGTEVRFKDKEKVARALYKNGRFLHLSAFSLPSV